MPPLGRNFKGDCRIQSRLLFSPSAVRMDTSHIKSCFLSLRPLQTVSSLEIVKISRWMVLHFLSSSGAICQHHMYSDVMTLR